MIRRLTSRNICSILFNNAANNPIKEIPAKTLNPYITFDYIYNSWLPTSGYQQAAGPYFERYGEAFSPADPRLSIYIPVEKKS